jgi:hypothetical protein
MNKSTLIISLIIVSAIFSKNFMAAGVSLSDVLMATTVVIIVTIHLVHRRKLIVSSNSIYLLLLWILALVGYSTLIIFNILPISSQEFMKSFAKFSFYLIFYFLVYSYLSKSARNDIDAVLLYILLANAFIAFYIFGLGECLVNPLLSAYFNHSDLLIYYFKRTVHPG